MTAISPLSHPGAAPRLRITPRGRAVIAVLIAAPLALGAVAFGLGQGAAASTGAGAGSDAGAASTSSSTGDFQWVTVEHGDSLWSIAQRVAPSSDPRDVIADIVQLNQLPSAAVSAGDRIAIPAKYAH